MKKVYNDVLKVSKKTFFNHIDALLKYSDSSCSIEVRPHLTKFLRNIKIYTIDDVDVGCIDRIWIFNIAYYFEKKDLKVRKKIAGFTLHVNKDMK